MKICNQLKRYQMPLPIHKFLLITQSSVNINVNLLFNNKNGKKISLQLDKGKKLLETT